MEGRLPSVIVLQVTPPIIELLLLRSIEWMTSKGGTYHAALEQAGTAVLRYSINDERVSLAKNLVEVLPCELALDHPPV
ncbi:uncharacterized protein BJ212DRAFT_1476140 [Suillus subaureus]|uniref:Nuclear pore complex protein n=1 Tax=Suillus subaureus TaxID=48587 RepID=A0A9P7EM21_9AGAM|nr:uncharacterized protein BJ212DRAFT_1476140 [Suillus subaureus]KAG1824851.1 hypothetical protein BJ212DRAFT_1476140 [Suillus subaureus]